jgi:hypothetical protein
MTEMRVFRTQNSAAIYRQVYPALLLYVSAGNCQTGPVDESGMIRNKMGTHNRSEMVAMQGSPYARTPHK